MKVLITIFFCLYFAVSFQTIAQVNNDIGVIAIDSPTSALCGTNHSVYTRVVNFGNNRVDSFTLNWSINGIVQTPVKKIMLLDTINGLGGDTLVVMLGVHQFTLGLPVTIRAWTSFPNGLSDPISTNDSTSVNRSLSSMKGIYTVNSSINAPDNFTTIDQAISALSLYGICGNTEIHIAAGIYTRTSPIVLGNITGTGINSKLTIKGSGNASCIISGNFDSSGVVIINQTKYFTIRNITVINTSATTPVGVAVIGATNGISVIGCVIKVPEVNSGYALNFTNSANGAGILACHSDSSLIDSNQISGGLYALAFKGASNSLFNRNLIISNNSMLNMSNVGMYLYTVYNSITVVNNNVVFSTVPVTGICSGINFIDNQNSSSKAHNIIRNKVAGFNGSGLLCVNYALSASVPALTISNNVFVSKTPHYQFGSYGIRVTQTGNIPALVYHNTVVMNTNYLTTVNSAAYYGDGSNNHDIRNNIFYVRNGLGLLVYLGVNLTAGQLNNNLYYHENVTPNINLISRAGVYYNETNYNTSAAGGDSSYYNIPGFEDAFLDNYALRHSCIKATNLLAVVSNDIRGNARSATPAPGAYEFTSTAANLSMLDMVKPDIIIQGQQDIKFRVINTGSNPVASYKVSYVSNNGLVVSQLKNISLQSCSIDTITFSGSNRINLIDSQYVIAYLDTIGSNDAEKESDTLRLLLRTGLKGNYTVGGLNPDFMNPQAALTALEERGLCGHVTLSLRAGSYEGMLQMKFMPGLCDTATLSLDGKNADSTIITHNTNSAVIIIDQVGFINIRNLSVVNTSALGAVGIWINSPYPKSISNIKISGCRITLLQNTSSNAITLRGQTVGSFAGCDSLYIDSNIIIGGSHGITISGSLVSTYNKGIIISRNTIRTATTGVEVLRVFNPVRISGNVIEGGSTGIDFSINQSVNSVQPHQITDNNISNFGVNGINCSNSGSAASARTIIANNEVRSSELTSVNAGIYVLAAASEKTGIYHNTVMMKGLSSSTNRGAIYNNGPLTEIKNNIAVVMKGSYYPVYIQGTYSGNNLNYNLYYNSAGQSLVYRGSAYNASNYRTASAGGDSSFNQLPPFTSIDSATLDLRLISKCILRGVNLPFITHDLNRILRTAPPALGAYEPNILSDNITVESITEPILNASIERGSHPMKLVVRNQGLNVLTQYSAGHNNNGITVSQTRIVNIANCQTDTCMFNGGNSIQIGAHNYIKAYVSIVGEQYPVDDTLVKELDPVLKGNYTIGNGSENDFESVAEAVNALNNRGVSGAVTFVMKPGIYLGPVQISGTIPGLSKSSSVTFDGYWKDSVSIIADTTDAVFLINKVKYVRLKNLTLENKKTSIGIAIVGTTAAVGSDCEITNCRVILPRLKGTLLSGGRGIHITSSANGNGTSSTGIDSVLIDSNELIGGDYGISFYGKAINTSNRSVVIRGNNIDSCNKSGIYLIEIYNPIQVTDNIVRLNGGAASSHGIYFFDNRISSSFHLISRNQIYNFGATGISSTNALSSATANMQITNNIVVSSDTSMGEESGLFGIRLQQLGTYPARIYNNTVIMRGNPKDYLGACFYNQGSSATQVVNNIFAVYNGAYKPAYFYTNTTAQVESNIYYVANDDSGTVLLYRSGTYTKENYLTIAGGGVQSSHSEPIFESLYQVKPSLKLLKGCMVNTQAGTNIPNVDVLGFPRAFFPTIGAIEHVKANLSVMPPVPFAIPVSSGPQDLKFISRNTSTDTIISYTASYQHNSGSPVSLIKNLSLKPCESDTVIFSGTSRPSLVINNDFTLYSGLVNGGASFRPDDTINVNVRTALSGTYTVGGANADFADLEAAIIALQQSGISGSVKFSINPGLYTGPFKIAGPIVGANTSFVISFEGADTILPVFWNSKDLAAITVSNIPNISFSKLKIESRGSGLLFMDNPSLSKTALISISNCIISTVIDKGIDVGYGSNNEYDSLIIDSNTISGTYHGIYVYGTGTKVMNWKTVISNNIINSPNSYGIYVSNLFNSANIEGNSVNISEQNGSITGIYFRYSTKDVSGSLNHQIFIKNNKVNRFSEYGIYAAVVGGYNSARLYILNNALIGTDGNSTTVNYKGIHAWTQSTAPVRIYHNSVVLQGTSNNTTNAALYMQDSPFDIRNNILAVYNGAANVLNANGGTGSVINHNLYYNNSPTAPHRIVNNLDSSNFKISGGDSSFIMKPPFVSHNYFPGNLSLTDVCMMKKGAALGGLIPNDIDNIPRSSVPWPGAHEHVPVASNISVKDMISPVQSDTISCGMHTVKYTVINAGINPVSQYLAHYTNNSGTLYTQTRNTIIAPCEIDTVIFTSGSKVYLGVKNELSCYTSNPNAGTDADRRGDTCRSLIQPRLVGEFIVGTTPSDFLTVKEAAQRLSRGVGGPVKFRIKTGNYKERVGVVGVNGTSPVKTVTFTSFANHKDSVKIYDVTSGSGTPNSGVITINSSAQYYIFDQLTIETDGAVSDYAIKLIGNASFDTIRNCKVAQPYHDISIDNVTVYGSSLTGTGLCFEDNIFSGGFYTMSLLGASRANPIKRLVLRRNTFGDGYSHLDYFDYCRTCEVSNNTFNNAVQGGVEFKYVDSAFKLISNKFTALNTYGSVIVRESKNDSSARAVIANNVVMGNLTTGLKLYENCSYVDMVHNTVSGVNGGLQFNPNGSTGIRILNNILTGSGAFYWISSSSMGNLISDYNAVPMYEVSQVTSPYLTPLQFKSTYAPLEANSVTVSPGLTSANNLMPDSTLPASWSVNGKGVHVGYALNDYENVTRPQTFAEGAPDIGAYEFTPVSLPQPLTATYVNSNTTAFLLGIDTMAKVTWTGPYMSGMTGRIYTGAYPPGINSNLSKSLNVYWDFTGPAGTNIFNMSLYYRYPLRGSIPSIANMIGAKKAGSNPWTFYQGTSVSVDSARNILTIKGLTDFSVFTGTDLNNPLPVKLLDFTGIKINRDVLLQWQTAEEKNVSHFEIHASTDGVNYEKLSENIFANGNSNSNYRYTDLNAFSSAKNTKYYKLRSVDFNGDYSWTDAVIVSQGNEMRNKITVYPNPFNNSVTVFVHIEGSANVSIVDVQGKVVYNEDALVKNGSIELTQLDGLKAGLYFITIKSRNEVYVKKLIKN